MPELWARILDALVGGPAAWQSPAELAAALGEDESRTTDLLAELDVAGWLAVWEFDDSLVVTLSALGAGRLGVRLIETAEDRAPRWARADEPEPGRPRARHVCTHQRAADLAFVVDPRPTPDQSAERAEVAARIAADPEDDRLPRPTLLLGQGLSPWPGPGRDHSAPCPVCRSNPLRPHEYCLCCDGWGLDGKVYTACPAGAPRPAARKRPDSPKPADGRDDRARRKSRRRRRLEAKAAADRRKSRPGRPSRKGPGDGGTPLA